MPSTAVAKATASRNRIWKEYKARERANAPKNKLLALRVTRMSEEEFDKYLRSKLSDAGLAYTICNNIMLAGTHQSVKRFGKFNGNQHTNRKTTNANQSTTTVVSSLERGGQLHDASVARCESAQLQSANASVSPHVGE